MDPSALFQQLLLFAHLIAFAIALSAVLREDLDILRTRRIDLRRLGRTARALAVALAVLWATGLALIAIDTGFDLAAVAARPKLAAKLVVVSVLTANGVLLHTLGLPRLARDGGGLSPLPVLLGAVSTASWLYAAFVGASRLIAPWMDLQGFLLGYAVLLGGALVLALLLLRFRPHPGVRRRELRAARRLTIAE